MDINCQENESEADVKERNRSAVIYGIKESKMPKVLKILGDDQSKIADILKLTGTQPTFFASRMGTIGDKTRPHKIIFPSREIQKQLIDGAKRIHRLLISSLLLN